jgi:hypothetical protein
MSSRLLTLPRGTPRAGRMNTLPIPTTHNTMSHECLPFIASLSRQQRTSVSGSPLSVSAPRPLSPRSLRPHRYGRRDRPRVGCDGLRSSPFQTIASQRTHPPKRSIIRIPEGTQSLEIPPHPSAGRRKPNPCYSVAFRRTTPSFTPAPPCPSWNDSACQTGLRGNNQANASNVPAGTWPARAFYRAKPRDYAGTTPRHDSSGSSPGFLRCHVVKFAGCARESA